MWLRTQQRDLPNWGKKTHCGKGNPVCFPRHPRAPWGPCCASSVRSSWPSTSCRSTSCSAGPGPSPARAAAATSCSGSSRSTPGSAGGRRRQTRAAGQRQDSGMRMDRRGTDGEQVTGVGLGTARAGKGDLEQLWDRTLETEPLMWHNSRERTLKRHNSKERTLGTEPLWDTSRDRTLGTEL